jgi:hypothetical protein
MGSEFVPELRQLVKDIEDISERLKNLHWKAHQRSVRTKSTMYSSSSPTQTFLYQQQHQHPSRLSIFANAKPDADRVQIKPLSEPIKVQTPRSISVVDKQKEEGVKPRFSCFRCCMTSSHP